MSVVNQVLEIILQCTRINASSHRKRMRHSPARLSGLFNLFLSLHFIFVCLCYIAFTIPFCFAGVYVCAPCLSACVNVCAMQCQLTPHY